MNVLVVPASDGYVCSVQHNLHVKLLAVVYSCTVRAMC